MNIDAIPVRRPRHLLVATVVAALGGFLFGYDGVAISGAIAYLPRYFHLGDVGTGWAGSCGIIGNLIGCGVIGMIIDRVGPKKALYLCAACFGFSSAGMYFAGSFTQFVVWRMIGGIGIGAASIVSPMYIAEIAPTRMRGRLVTLYQVGIVVGILLAVFGNMLIQRLGDDAWNLQTGWRWMLVTGLLPAIVFAGLIVPAVESPRWLMKMGFSERGFRVLCQLNGRESASVESAAIQESLGQEEGRFSELFTPGFGRALLVGVILAAMSQASGISPVFTYLPEMFKAAGTATSDAFFQSVLVGGINLVFTLVAMWLVDLAGRKTLLLMGTFIQFLAMAAVGWLYHAHASGIGVLVGVMAFVSGHAVGNGVVCWVIISEIFPTRLRGRAMSISTAALWGSGFLSVGAFPIMRQHWGDAGAFWWFGGAALLNLVLVLALVPETKGRSLEEIEQIWTRRANLDKTTKVEREAVP